MKTVVKLPNEYTQEATRIEVLSDGYLVASIRGIIEEIRALEFGKWFVLIRHADHLSFLFVDAIRRK